MGQPTVHVLAALELLQTQPRITGPELAQRLGVSVRTVRRYMVTLQEIGVPILSEPGRNGAYSLVGGFKLPPMMFTNAEAVALALGLRLARNLGLANADVALESAQAKLLRVLPLEAQTSLVGLSAIDARIGSDAAPAIQAAHLAIIGAAMRRQRSVCFDYAAPQGRPAAREANPYGLVHQFGRWYLVGWCHLRKALRTFRLDRVGALREGTSGFSRPAGFNAAQHLETSIKSIPRAHTVRVRCAGTLADVQQHLPEGAFFLEDDGDGVWLTGQVDDLNWMARVLARLGVPFAIAGPAALREAVRALANHLQKCATS